jgi:spore coat protein U-like protein
MVAVDPDGAKSIDRDTVPCSRLRGPGRLMMRLAALLAATATLWASPASAQRVQISELGDVSFGLLTNLNADTVRNQDICVYSQSNGYNVRAFGNGSGGAFTLSDGANMLAYEVQWNSSAGQVVGTTLAANAPLTGQLSSAQQRSCNQGPSASLIIVLRSAALSSATAGTYTGTLTLVVEPE